MAHRQSILSKQNSSQRSMLHESREAQSQSDQKNVTGDQNVEYVVDVFENSDEEEKKEASHQPSAKPQEEEKKEKVKKRKLRDSSSSDEEVVKWSLLGPVLKPGEKRNESIYVIKKNPALLQAA